MKDPGSDPSVQRTRMVEEQLKARGIRSHDVLRVMGEVPREHFLPPERRGQAYTDQALPLSRGQTISQPFMVAVMTEALGISPGDRILEIGTGSGYQTAVLCRLAWRVFTVERIPELKDQAQAALDALGISNVAFLQGDGSQGWPEQAPFDAILVTAGAPQIPEALKDQLVDTGGTLVIPVGDRWVQKLLRVTREGTSFVQEELLACRFVPLVGAGGWETPEPL